MPALALALYLIWLAVSFGLRSAVHRHRTGSTGFLLPPQRGIVEWCCGVAFIGSLVLGLAAPVAQMGGLAPLAVLDHAALAAAGATVAVMGIGLTFLAQLEMGESWRVGVDPAVRTTLVRSGFFGWVRNPIFTAMVTTAAGTALVVPNPLSVAAVGLLVLGLELQVRLVEEPYLRRTHGAAYESYAGAVGRFVPGVGRWRTG